MLHLSSSYVDGRLLIKRETEKEREGRGGEGVLGTNAVTHPAETTQHNALNIWLLCILCIRCMKYMHNRNIYAFILKMISTTTQWVLTKLCNNLSNFGFIISEQPILDMKLTSNSTQYLKNSSQH